jgi:thiol-disulfide isomerase/thioredoxin
MRFVKVNTEAERELSARFRIRSIPTIMMFKNGEVIDMLNGAVPKAPFDSWLNEAGRSKPPGHRLCPVFTSATMAFFLAIPMTDNAVLRLRAERLARATRPFLARGNRIHRCQRCCCR